MYRGLTALILLTFKSSQAISVAPTVDLGYAKYTGVQNATFGITSFFGIKYAHPPTSNLRFRAPVPIEQNSPYDPSIPINASIQGPVCFQGTPGWQTTPTTPSPQPGSEDCLLLDILVPSQPRNASLPVMVQIHGGGYVARNSESYPGYALVNQSQGGLVFVSLQYRLGAFGWLNVPEIRADGSVNLGLLDQRAALEWVGRHVEAFGGDPDKVTLAGNSAGGGSVVGQMVMFGGVERPPFRAVVVEYPWWQPYHNPTILQNQYNNVLASSNCSTLTCLRSVPARTLDLASQAAMVTGYSTHDYGYGDYYYGPSIDGTILRDLPSHEFAQGHFTKVPLLVDRDGYEGFGFSNQSVVTFDEEMADLGVVFPAAGMSFFRRLWEVYPAREFNSTFFQRVKIFGDFIINCPTYYMASSTSDWQLPTWKMVFYAGSEIHGATVPFIFYTDPSKINNATLAYIMKDYFLSFIMYLDPNVQSFTGIAKPYWPQYGDGFGVMNVQYTSMEATRDPDASDACDFFHGQSYVTRN